MVKGKGQTRSWLIIVPLPAGEKCRKKTSDYKLREQVIAKIMTTMLILYTFYADPRAGTIQLIKRIINMDQEWKSKGVCQ
jgi:hypothetical protein